MLPKPTASAVRLPLIASLTLALGFSSIVSAQRRPGGWAGRGDRQADNSDDKDKKKDAIKPYDEVITDEAVTKRGLFHVHQIDDDLYYEIPLDAFDKDMLWVTTIAQTTAGSSYAGMPAGERVVRWEMRGEKVLLRDVRYAIRADTDDPIAEAVKASNLAPIIKVFPVKAYGTDKKPVIKVTDLFTKEVDEFSAKRSLNAGNMDSGRSFIEEIKTFPTNIETRVLATYAPASSNNSGGASPFGRRGGGRGGAITAMIHHSMVKLPDNPMKPRVHDSRVGFFSVRFVDFADNKNHAAETVRYITRWRLEKKDPEAELSEPIKPIVFYVGRGTPEKWKSYVKAGIEDWQPAFEAAGFKNAIIGKYAPDPQEDPEWDAEDARISTIRWLPASIKNAFGPHVSDPRTGEILEADVRMYHDVQKLVRDWYFVQAAAVDERAQNLPMPDDLIGELIRFVVAHEVGHSLGFPHNMKASSSYSIEQLRDADWVKNNGTAPSIMDYARFNYVAQPGDEAGLLPRVGPYDYFAAEWGYRQFASDADEKAELELIAKRQIDEPMFRYGGGGGDPTAQTEDLSNQAIQATTLGLKNLERIAALIIDATSKEGEDYDLLSNMYNELFGQWNREMGHVANIVGGVEQVNLYYGDADQRFFPLDADDQRDAVRFLVENALRTPNKMIPTDISLRLTADGVADRVLSAQSRLLRTLVNARRVNRMAEHAENIEYGAYTPAEMLADLRYGIYSELNDTPMDIDIYRRNLQRTYVQMLGSLIENPSANSDLPALARAELVALGASIEGCDSAAADNAIVTAHLRDLSARIEAALDHRATRAAPSATPAPTGRRRAGNEDSPDRGWCSVPLEPEKD